MAFALFLFYGKQNTKKYEMVIKFEISWFVELKIKYNYEDQEILFVELLKVRRLFVEELNYEEQELLLLRMVDLSFVIN